MITDKNKAFLARYGKHDIDDVEQMIADDHDPDDSIAYHFAQNPFLPREYVRKKVFGGDYIDQDTFKNHPSLTEHDHDEMIVSHNIFPDFDRAKKSYIKHADKLQDNFLHDKPETREGLLNCIHSDQFPLKNEVVMKIIKSDETNSIIDLSRRKTLPQTLKDNMWVGNPYTRVHLMTHTNNDEHINHVINGGSLIDHRRLLINRNLKNEHVMRLKKLYDSPEMGYVNYYPTKSEIKDRINEIMTERGLQ